MSTGFAGASFPFAVFFRFFVRTVVVGRKLELRTVSGRIYIVPLGLIIFQNFKLEALPVTDIRIQESEFQLTWVVELLRQSNGRWINCIRVLCIVSACFHVGMFRNVSKVPHCQASERNAHFCFLL